MLARQTVYHLHHRASSVYYILFVHLSMANVNANKRETCLLNPDQVKMIPKTMLLCAVEGGAHRVAQTFQISYAFYLN
jgi:hypothetical protein